MNITEWQAKHGVSDAAVAELIGEVSLESLKPSPLVKTEADVMVNTRIMFQKLGGRLFRNNVGACTTAAGSFVRYGLANESHAMNRNLKSSDLIGIVPVTITPEMIGQQLGRFAALECKRPGWKFNPNDERENAQFRFITLVNKLGGSARFVTDARAAHTP